jgi:hypothetical protein
MTSSRISIDFAFVMVAVDVVSAQNDIPVLALE